MSQDSSLRQSLGPLSVGNVISAALRIYRDHFKSYIGVAFRATLWSFCPLILLLPLVFIVIAAAGNDSNYTTSIVLALIFLPLWLFVAIYCGAKALTNSATISRVVFAELINKLETLTEAYQQIKRKFWQFWVTQFLVGIFLFILSLILQAVQTVVFNLPATQINNNFITPLLIFLGYVFYYVVYLWFCARFFIPEVPLAVENSLSSFDAISRSWTLSKGYAWRIVWIITVAFLITLPVYILAGIPIVAAFAYAYPILVFGFPSVEIIVTLILSIIAGILIFLLLNMLAIPFWQAIKSVIYYDLRSRREGLGLTLRDSDESF